MNRTVRNCFVIPILFALVSPLNGVFWFEGAGQIKEQLSEALKREKQHLAELGLLHKKLDAFETQSSSRIAAWRTAAWATLLCYSLSNTYMLFLSNQLLDPSLWSFWMGQFPLETISPMKVEVGRKLISDIMMRYMGTLDPKKLVSDQKQQQEIVNGAIETFMLEINHELQGLRLYRKIARCIYAIPGARFFFVIDPAITSHLDDRLERLAYYQDLCISALTELQSDESHTSPPAPARP